MSSLQNFSSRSFRHIFSRSSLLCLDNSRIQYFLSSLFSNYFSTERLLLQIHLHNLSNSKRLFHDCFSSSTSRRFHECISAATGNSSERTFKAIELGTIKFFSYSFSHSPSGHVAKSFGNLRIYEISTSLFKFNFSAATGNFTLFNLFHFFSARFTSASQANTTRGT